MSFSVQEMDQLSDLIDRKFDEKFDEKFDQKFDEKFDEKFAPIFNDLNWIKTELSLLKEELALVKHQVNRISEEVTSLREEQFYLKQFTDQQFCVVRHDIESLKIRLDQYLTMESEDVQAVHKDLKGLKKEVNDLDFRVMKLELGAENDPN